MIFRPHWIILALTIYFPFENFLLKWLPVSDKTYSLSRLVGEILIYCLFTLVLFNRVWTGGKLRRTPIDMPLIVFLLLAFLSIYINNAPFIGGLINIRTLLRYVAVYYIIVNLNFTEAHARNIVFAVILIAIIESIIGITQHYSGISSFWLPRAPELEVEGYKTVFTVLGGGIERGAAIGTFVNGASLAMFLLWSEVLMLSIFFNTGRLSSRRRSSLALMFILLLFAVLLTYSRASLLAVILAIPLTLFFLKRKRLLLHLCVTCVVFFLLLSVMGFFTVRPGDLPSKALTKQKVTPMTNLKVMFTKSYKDKLSSGRLWVIEEVGRSVLKSGTLLGYSPDQRTAREQIVTISRGAHQKLLNYRAFEDVYWVAMLSYYGFAGLGIFIIVLYRLFKTSMWVTWNSVELPFRVISVALSVVIVILLPLSFIIQALESRAFSFYFWLFAGLMMTEYHRQNGEALGG